MMRQPDRLLLVMVLTLVLGGCKKDSATASRPVDGSTIKYVLNDNFNFSVTYDALQYTGILDTLAGPGPLTFVAQDNSAFQRMNITVIDDYWAGVLGPARLQQWMQYCILPGRISLKALPLAADSAFKTLTGGKVYVSKFLNGTDTMITINGVPLANADAAASNGLIQSISQPLNAEIYPNLSGYIHSDTNLTYFAAAMQHAGLDLSLLTGKDKYTLLAPSNAAFRNSAGLGLAVNISCMDSILASDAAQLAAVLKYHILKGRYFQGDLYRAAQADPSSGITALNGEKVVIGGNPSGFYAISFLGNGNQGIPSVIQKPAGYAPWVFLADLPAGNGVVHIINQVLVP